MLSAVSAAISADDFAQALENFAPLSESKIAIAVSGGPDSMALAFCLKRAGYPCIALIVDHALRDGSGAEAAQVKINLQQMGMQAEILYWQHEPVTSKLHERARAVRYHLLLDACRRHNIETLLTAHHRDDQAETILMRMMKGSAVEGLSGIAADSRRNDVRLLRPFLDLPKSRLVATCQENNIAFVTDPSNASDKFSRGRLRALMPLLAQEGLTADSLVKLGTRAAEAADALSHYVREFLSTAAVIELGGSIRLDTSRLSALPRAIALRALARCLRTVNADDYPPEQESMAGLLDDIISTQNETTRSLYGCLISITANRLIFMREPVAATETIPLSAGQCVLWDGRWHVYAPAHAPDTDIRALGNAEHDIIDALAPRLRHDIPQGRIRASLPALWIGDRLHAVPSFGETNGFYATYRKLVFP